MRSKLRIIVTGLIAQYPLGGVTWDYLQYVLGLIQLGHDVYYVEDSGQWPYNPGSGGLGKDCDFNIQYLAAVMSRYGLAEQWAYRFPWQSQWFGISDIKRKQVIESADLLVNVSGSLEYPEQYRQVRRMAYIDSDPVFTQIKLARGQLDFRKWIDMHDVHFSFGECLSAKIPETGHQWRPTRQPIVLSEWRPHGSFREVFTTVMNWTSYKPVMYEEKCYGQKDLEFLRFQDLPSLVAPTALEIAVNAGKTRRTPRQLLAHKGWRVVDPANVCPDLDSYRRYIESSKAEWSVAKNGYVRGQPGWFSCRSACYLAAGKPVAVQDTGFSNVLPVGEGLVPFSTVEEAAVAIGKIQENYKRHAKAAREIAEGYFAADKVLNQLLHVALA
jgi:hypothetical protein